MKIALIDGDSLCYLCSKDDILTSLQSIDSLIRSIMSETGSDAYHLFLSTGPYFRHRVNPDYKGNRKSSSPLKYLKTTKAYLVEEYGGKAFEGVEADDMVAWASSKIQETSDECVVCAIDKDVTKQIVGHHFDYKKHIKSHTMPADAAKFLYQQALQGDSTDNITGIPRVGEAKAKAIVERCESPTELRAAVLQAYQDYYKGIGPGVYAFQQNFRQVYLLRKDQDFLNEVGYVPELLEPRTL